MQLIHCIYLWFHLIFLLTLAKMKKKWDPTAEALRWLCCPGLNYPTRATPEQVSPQPLCSSPLEIQCCAAVLSMQQW